MSDIVNEQIPVYTCLINDNYECEMSVLKIINIRLLIFVTLSLYLNTISKNVIKGNAILYILDLIICAAWK